MVLADVATGVKMPCFMANVMNPVIMSKAALLQYFLIIICFTVVAGLEKQVMYSSVSLSLPWVTQSELQMLLCVTMSQAEPKRPGEEGLLPGSQLTSVEHIHMCSRLFQRC